MHLFLMRLEERSVYFK
ncbi:Protein of unknown function [Lactobacillus helveticus CIRM-BIA 103]|nr:Protein of unknown function [Lactobacillus helveticus CIRM-BIA 103]